MIKMKRPETPVYLFTGFLDSGKTTFIQGTLNDSAFNAGENTLVLLCEEGEVEIDETQFAFPNVTVVTIDDEDELTTEYLEKLQKEIGFERVVIEYNGMWLLDELYAKIPENWVIYQEMCLMDARIFMTYNTNMRNLVYDKLKSVETIVFKYFDEAMDKMEFHKIVRGANRRCDIIYEYSENKIEFDNMEDPLPFDIDAPVVVVEDKDYALWYRDITEEEQKYYGKTIRVKGRSLTGGGLKDDEFVIGRHIMTCCVDDITFGGLVAKYDKSLSLEHGGWAQITAEIKCEFNEMYGEKGPVLYVKELEVAEPLEQDVATFY